MLAEMKILTFVSGCKCSRLTPGAGAPSLADDVPMSLRARWTVRQHKQKFLVVCPCLLQTCPGNGAWQQWKRSLWPYCFYNKCEVSQRFCFTFELFPLRANQTVMRLEWVLLPPTVAHWHFNASLTDTAKVQVTTKMKSFHFFFIYSHHKITIQGSETRHTTVNSPFTLHKHTMLTVCGLHTAGCSAQQGNTMYIT